MRRILWLLCALNGCNVLEEFLPPEPNCSPRSAYWRDEDGDGVGESGTIFIGCKAPDGYVSIPPLPGPDTGDTDPADTDPADTDPADTDPGDTDDTDGVDP